MAHDAPIPNRLRFVAASAVEMSATDISDRARVSDGPAIPSSAAAAAPGAAAGAAASAAAAPPPAAAAGPRRWKRSRRTSPGRAFPSRGRAAIWRGTQRATTCSC